MLLAWHMFIHPDLEELTGRVEVDRADSNDEMMSWFSAGKVTEA